MELLLSSETDRISLRARFLVHNFLFLISAPSGIELSDKPKIGTVIYAVFSRRRRHIVCAALHSDVVLKSGSAVATLCAGDRISVGPVGLLVRLQKDSNRTIFGRCGTLLTFVVAACMIAGAVFVFSGGRSQPPMPSGQATITPGSETPADNFLAEIREHLRTGRVDQARLSLMQFLERSPGDVKATELLKEIEADAAKEAHVQGDNQDKYVEAEKLFNAGVESLHKGDLAEARRLLDESAQVITEYKIAPMFASGLEEARGEVVLRLKEGLAPHLGAARRLAKSAEGLECLPSIGKLAAAKEELDAVGDSLQADAEAEGLRRDIERATSAVIDRCLAAAMTVERLSGCEKAGVLYGNIAGALARMSPAAATDARTRAARCGSRGID